MHRDWHYILTQAPVRIIALAAVLAPSLQTIKTKLPALTGWKALLANFVMSAIGVLAFVDTAHFWTVDTWAHVLLLTLTASGVHNLMGKFGSSEPTLQDPQPQGDLAAPAPAPAPATILSPKEVVRLANAQALYSAVVASPDQPNHVTAASLRRLADTLSPTVADPTAQPGEDMDDFAKYLGLSLAILPVITEGIQTVVGDTASGADKRTMAYDALGVALQGADSIIPAGDTDDKALAQGAAGTAALGITLADSIGKLVTFLKSKDQVSKVVTQQKANGVAAFKKQPATGSASQGIVAAAAVPGTQKAA